MAHYTNAIPPEVVEAAELLKTVGLRDPLDESMHVFCGTPSAVLAYFIRCGIEPALRLAVIEYNWSCEAFRIWNEIGCRFDEGDIDQLYGSDFAEGTEEHDLIIAEESAVLPLRQTLFATGLAFSILGSDCSTKPSNS